MKGAIEMDAGFLVDGDPSSAGFRESGDEFVRPFYHEMTVEWDFRDFAKRGYHRRADRKIRNEMAVHDVDVENSGSALDGSPRLFAEAREVSRQDGRSELDHGNVQPPTWA